MNNILEIKNRKEFRKWLEKNSNKEKECYIKSLKRGKPLEDNTFYYLDAVEEALCFGWIDSKYIKVEGILYQRFSPRLKNSNWTILNIARIKRLNKLGLMKEEGLKYFPKEKYIQDKDILKDIKDKGLLDIFKKFPKLYQDIRISTLASIKKNSLDQYKSSFNNFIKYTKQNKMYGLWNDYGRLDDTY